MRNEVVSDWGRLIREQFMSGESQRRYCRKRGVSLSSFQYQKSKRVHLKRESPEFVRIAVGAIEEGRIEIEVGSDVRLCFPMETPAERLSEVVRCLSLK